MSSVVREAHRSRRGVIADAHHGIFMAFSFLSPVRQKWLDRRAVVFERHPANLDEAYDSKLNLSLLLSRETRCI